jgi:hypothetical protein
LIIEELKDSDSIRDLFERINVFMLQSSIIFYVAISVKSVRDELKRGVLLCPVLLFTVLILVGDVTLLRSLRS